MVLFSYFTHSFFKVVEVIVWLRVERKIIISIGISSNIYNAYGYKGRRRCVCFLNKTYGQWGDGNFNSMLWTGSPISNINNWLWISLRVSLQLLIIVVNTLFSFEHKVVEKTVEVSNVWYKNGSISFKSKWCDFSTFL